MKFCFILFFNSSLNIIGSITREHHDSLIRQAQQCLQLVVTDFLSTIPIYYLGILIKVVAKFGFQEQDLNIALSAIGLLWNMTDYLFRMKEQENELKLHKISQCLCL